MKAWLIRLKSELQELQERIEKLQKFLSSDNIQEISKQQLSLMSQQLVIMREYEYILISRIKEGEANEH